jgi:hypothetical protein
VPYSADDVSASANAARTQAAAIAKEIADQGGPKDLADKEITALIA